MLGISLSVLHTHANGTIVDMQMGDKDHFGRLRGGMGGEESDAGYCSG